MEQQGKEKTETVQKKQKKENKRMTSIARRINGLWVWKQCSIYLFFDLFVAFLILVCWCYLQEKAHFDAVSLQGVTRHFQMEKGIGSIVYIVKKVGHPALRVKAGLFFLLFRNCAVVVVSIQLFFLLRSALFDSKAIRHQLHPLNELAKKAEQISSIAFDESKYHLLENAISQMKPEQGKQHLHMGDKDLEGLETAVNNLIDRMQESYRQQSRFVSDASHELRTPISVIQGYVNMLDRWGKEDETVLEEAIDAIKHESEHMSKLVGQLLFLARSDSGRNKMEMEMVSISDLLREVYDESMMIDTLHVYRYESSETPVMVTGDRTMLKQTMRILTDNAVKYTKKGDEIVFRTGRQGAEAFFQIQDMGSGMGQEEVVHVFERFYRSDEARNSKTGGSGLGLSIAKWIVDKHRGHFDILSRKNLGTRITVFLPVQKEL